MNMNELAREISLLEGGKQSLSIGQIKEVLKITAIIISGNPLALASMLKNGYGHLIKDNHMLSKGK